MRFRKPFSVALYVLTVSLAACSGTTSGTCPWLPDAGAYAGSCPGKASVDAGMLAGGAPGAAVAASRFGALGARVILATNSADGCSMETSGSSSDTNEAAVILLTLAPGLCPGTYAVSTDAGTPVQAQLSYNYYGTGWSRTVSGSVSLSQIDAAQGVQGTYHLDFGLSPIAGGGGTLPGDGGVISFGPLGELIEDGSFVAPPCDLCPSVPDCGDAGCPAGQICQRGCGGPEGECEPAPTCQGAASCDNCTLDLTNCGFSGGCFFFDGFSLACGCAP